jgi:hypothetical protein
MCAPLTSRASQAAPEISAGNRQPFENDGAAPPENKKEGSVKGVAFSIQTYTHFFHNCKHQHSKN